MSFEFVPRSVKKRQIEPVIGRESLAHGLKGNSKTTPPNTSSTQECVSASNRPVAKPATAPSKEPDFEVLADLVRLALSDYALWADADLRRRIDWSIANIDENEEAQNPNESSGYIPLAYLFRKSPVFLQAASSSSFTQHPETTYVKALRTYAADSIDVRLVLSSEEPQFGRTSSSNQTGYEVRKKAVATTDEDHLTTYGKADWDRLTFYMENIPTQYRTLPGTLKLVAGLLRSTPPPTALCPRVQNISFPRHHRDPPGAQPACKGFALVTLSAPHDVAYLLDRWPWDAQVSSRSNDDADCTKDDAAPGHHSGLQVLRDATRAGVRSLGKARWDALRAEYTRFRQALVAELGAFQEQEHVRRRVGAPPVASAASAQSSRVHEPGASAQPPSEGSGGAQCPQAIRADAAYPAGCLVFVRGLHPETNKTTLRALFARAWDTASAAGIDYVDYMKGMDSCHVRLSTPAHAQRLADHFAAHPTAQSTGLDAAGTRATPQQAISAELVLGRREEVYWEKVPEKVRRQAVEKALKLIAGDDEIKENTAEAGGSKRRRR